MADSEAAICNIALGRIGHTEFIDTLDDATVAAEMCKRLYPQARDEVLEALDWPFARRRYKPAAILETTLDLGDVPSGWSFAFALPADAIPNGIRRVWSGMRRDREDLAVPFDVEYDLKTQQDILLVDFSTPEVLYTARVTDPKTFAATFTSAVAWRLGQELVPALRKDKDVAQDAAKMYLLALADASAAARQGVRQDPEPVPRHIAARG